jgi:hypothetical protein
MRIGSVEKSYTSRRDRDGGAKNNSKQKKAKELFIGAMRRRRRWQGALWRNIHTHTHLYINTKRRLKGKKNLISSVCLDSLQKKKLPSLYHRTKRKTPIKKGGVRLVVVVGGSRRKKKKKQQQPK